MLKKIIPWLVVGIFAVVFVVAFALKDTMNETISEMMKQQASPKLTSSGEVLADSLFNYVKNGQDYEITLLEFGSTGCTICKQMETELDKIKKSQSGKINVIFLNTSYPENQKFVKFFGISAIPMQVMLDKNGVEFFKHYGFISAEDLMEKARDIQFK